jgi:hypothetical protein
MAKETSEYESTMTDENRKENSEAKDRKCKERNDERRVDDKNRKCADEEEKAKRESERGRERENTRQCLST